MGDDYETDKYLITVDSLVEHTGGHVTSCQPIAVAQPARPPPQPAFHNKLANSKSRKVCVHFIDVCLNMSPVHSVHSVEMLIKIYC